MLRDVRLVEPPAAVQQVPTARRVLAVRVLAVLTVVLVAGCLVVGLRATDTERARSDTAAQALPRGAGGVPVFVASQVPEGFIQFALGRIPEHDPVGYMAPGVDLCHPGGTQTRYVGQVFWMQYRLAPRPTVCGTHARWLVYLNTPVPAGVLAADRWSPMLAVVRIG